MTQVRCFLVERAARVRVYLRRWHEVGERFCQGRVLVDERDEVPGEVFGRRSTEVELLDPRWPKTCSCGHEFVEADAMYVSLCDLWRLPDGGLREQGELPPGAMWRAPWMAEIGWRGPDGDCLVVKCPDGCEWVIDGPSENTKTPWTRTGTPPEVTCEPSIQTPNYHGHLRAGVFTEA